MTLEERFMAGYRFPYAHTEKKKRERYPWQEFAQ